jgi:hypothetical protein
MVCTRKVNVLLKSALLPVKNPSVFFLPLFAFFFLLFPRVIDSSRAVNLRSTFCTVSTSHASVIPPVEWRVPIDTDPLVILVSLMNGLVRIASLIKEDLFDMMNGAGLLWNSNIFRLPV